MVQSKNFSEMLNLNEEIMNKLKNEQMAKESKNVGEKANPVVFTDYEQMVMDYAKKLGVVIATQSEIEGMGMVCVVNKKKSKICSIKDPKQAVAKVSKKDSKLVSQKGEKTYTTTQVREIIDKIQDSILDLSNLKVRYSNGGKLLSCQHIKHLSESTISRRNKKAKANNDTMKAKVEMPSIVSQVEDDEIDFYEYMNIAE